MLICGEDLGMVLKGVPKVMKQLGILSLEIQRMPKDENRIFLSFPCSLFIGSNTLYSRYEHNTFMVGGRQRKDTEIFFFNNELAQWVMQPSTCEAWINKAIIIQHLHSPAMWSIFQMQDLFGIDESIRRPDHLSERINVPAIFNHFGNIECIFLWKIY